LESAERRVDEWRSVVVGAAPFDPVQAGSVEEAEVSPEGVVVAWLLVRCQEGGEPVDVVVACLGAQVGDRGRLASRLP
jgi:hypothetical protein